MLLIVAISVFAACLVIALIIGLVKGYTKTRTWALEYLFAVVLSALIYALADLSDMKPWLSASLKIGTAVAFILVFALLSWRGKALFSKCIANARKRSYYEQYGDREENTLQILDAIESGDAKEYKRLTNRKFKENSGAAGVANRICGALTLMIKIAVILGMVALIAFVVMDFTHLKFVSDYFGKVYESGLWKFVSKFAMDAFVIGVIFVAIRTGFRSGVVSVLWALAVLGMIGGAAYLSYGLCFNIAAFRDTAESLNGTIGGVTGAIADMATKFGMKNITSEKIAQIVLGTGIFILLLIVVIIVGLAVSGMISRAREGKAFSTVDGVIGAVVAFAVATFVMLFIGAVLWTLNDLPFMGDLNAYMFYTSSKGELKPAAIASVFYSKNPLNDWSVIQNLPVRGWFK